MKKLHLIVLCLLSSLSSIGQGITERSGINKHFPEPKIDERIEILSIVFRLAGSWEYSSNVYASYTEDIYSHFDNYKDHPLIAFASKLYNENGVAYDAVMKMAFNIDQPPTFTPKVQFTENVPEERWGVENAYKFVELLRDFYRVSDFEGFFKKHSGLYEIAIKRFSPVYDAVNIEWYNQYYGAEPCGSYHVIISLGNGGSSYGGKIIFPDKREEAYSILGTWMIDSTDTPVYTKEAYLETLIHEFNHSYVNPLIDTYEKQLENSGKIIFEPIQNSLSRQAYNKWIIMMYESLVRASVISYLLQYESYEVANKRLITEMGNGFYWMQGLVNVLQQYETNRGQYETLESYMPEIIRFFNKVAKESESMLEVKK